MVPGSKLAEFAALALVLIAIPGPSVLFVISRGVVLGRRAAFATVAGNCAGVYVQVIAVAFGVGVLVERSAAVYTTIKLLGAAYLVWLGLRTFQRRRSLAAALEATVAAKSGRRIIRDGFVVGVTNPKAAVFFAAILPQFADSARGEVPLQMLLLGLVFVSIAMVCDGLWRSLRGRPASGSRPRRGASRRSAPAEGSPWSGSGSDWRSAAGDRERREALALSDQAAPRRVRSPRRRASLRRPPLYARPKRTQPLWPPSPIAFESAIST